MPNKVSINVLRGKLRLVWSYAGDRYFLHTGLHESAISRKVAEAKALVIEADMVTDNFDETLRKYKESDAHRTQISVVELFEQFTKWKSKRVDARTMEKYYGLKSRLKNHFRNRGAEVIKESDAIAFREYLLEDLAEVTAKERLSFMSACWTWAIATKKIRQGDNPWKGIPLVVPPKPKPRPFTESEIKRILIAFEESRHFKFYLDYVRFLFGTGVRTGEAIGLLWDHVSPDCKKIWIGESYSRGRRKATKTNKARDLVIPGSLVDMLQSRRQESGLVFPSKTGNPIDDHNFRNRAWTKSLKRAGVMYRKPYNTRHTFISHCLASGMNPVDVAAITGHDVKTLYEDYAGVIGSTPKVPELGW